MKKMDIQISNKFLKQEEYCWNNWNLEEDKQNNSYYVIKHNKKKLWKFV